MSTGRAYLLFAGHVAAEQVRLDDQADVVQVGKLFHVGTQQHVPALALLPLRRRRAPQRSFDALECTPQKSHHRPCRSHLEDGKEAEAARVGQRQRARRIRVKQLHVHGFRQEPQLVADAPACDPRRQRAGRVRGPKDHPRVSTFLTPAHRGMPPALRTSSRKVEGTQISSTESARPICRGGRAQRPRHKPVSATDALPYAAGAGRTQPWGSTVDSIMDRPTTTLGRRSTRRRPR